MSLLCNNVLLQIEEAAADLLSHFNHRNVDAIVKAVRHSLESIKKRISSTTVTLYGGKYLP